MIAIEMATDINFNGMCKLDESYACQEWFDWNHCGSDYLARQNNNLRGHWDMDLEQSNSLSFFAIDRDSDCADNLDLPCMALELEKEVMELEAARAPGKAGLASSSKKDSSNDTSSQDGSLSAESLLACSAATNEQLSAAAARASIPSLALYASEEERDELDVLQIDSDDECTMSANGTHHDPATASPRAAEDDTDGLSDQDNHSAAHEGNAPAAPAAAAAGASGRASWQTQTDTGCSALPGLPRDLPAGTILRPGGSQKGPVIIVQNGERKQISGCSGNGSGPIIRPLGPLPSGEDAAKTLGAYFQGNAVAGPIQVTASVPTGAYPAGAYKLQPVTLRPVMLMPAKGAAGSGGAAAAPPTLPATFNPTPAAGSYDPIRLSTNATASCNLERLVVQPASEHQPAAAPAQPPAAVTGRQRQSKMLGKQHKREASEQGGSPKGCKRSRGQGPARVAAAPAGHCCTQCGTQTTPVWRAGPQGPKTLCNACGVRYMKTAKKK